MSIAAELSGSCPQRRRGKLRIIRFHAGVKAHSLRCPSSPNRTRFAGLRFGWEMRQGAVTLCCIVLTIAQFQTETDVLYTLFIVFKALQFQGFQRR